MLSPAPSTPPRTQRLVAHLFSDSRALIAGPSRLWLILFAYASLVALAILDNYVWELRIDWAEAVVAVLVLLDFPALGRRGLREIALRLAFIAAAFALTILIAEALRRSFPVPENTIAFVWEMMREFHCERLYPAILWLFSPFALDWVGRPRPHRDPALNWRTAIAATLILLTAWAFITAYASLMPLRSFRGFHVDLGIFAALSLFWLRHAPGWPQLQRAARAAVLALLMLGTLAAAAAGWTFVFAGPEIKRQMVLAEYEDARVIDSNWSTARGYVPWRLSFPLGHHNRVAFYSMLCLLAFTVGSAAASRRPVKIALGLFALLAAANILMTLNRGVLLALAPAIFITAFSIVGRRALWLLLLIPLIFVALPRPQQKRALSIFKAETYQRDPTVVQRLGLFRAASLMVLDHPVLGIGYGWDHMERTMRDEYSAKVGQPPLRLHAHNVWLQTAAETGVPGLAFWILFTAARWGLLLAAWRRRQQFSRADQLLIIGWVAIETAIQVYSLSNFPLRRSLGLITWILWAMMAADCLALLARRRECETPDHKKE